MKEKVLTFIRKNKMQKGFTLIEMVVVIAIIVLLLLIIAPNLARQKQNAEKSTDRAFKTTLQTQVELYENEYGEKDKPNFAELRDKKYLTAKQYDKANKNYQIENGIVKKKK